MKKTISIILSLCLMLGMSIGRTVTASATEPIVNEVSTYQELQDAINKAPENNMEGEPTYIRLIADISYEYALQIGGNRNIHLDLNGHTLGLSVYLGKYNDENTQFTPAKLTIVNGKIVGLDANVGYASQATNVGAGSLIADNVVFQGGNGLASGVVGGYGILVDEAYFELKNCTVNSGNSYEDATAVSALRVSKGTGIISNTTFTRGSGIIEYYNTVSITNSDVKDGFGNKVISSEINENTVKIPGPNLITSVNDGENSKSTDVKATYVAGSTADTVYSVDLQWGSMEFTYTGESQGTWNPETHEYDNGIAGGWTWADKANEIVVTNHSNAPVKAKFAYTPAADYDKINGAFKGIDLVSNEATLNAGVENNAKDASKVTSALEISGDLASSTAEKTKLGTVTVTISEP